MSNFHAWKIAEQDIWNPTDVTSHFNSITYISALTLRNLSLSHLSLFIAEGGNFVVDSSENCYAK